mmetsp:Transcript_8588/g.18494  ORF Transcript_8588/g.18494 Transcript_8588/m.18494 type:complete len:366 (+) Transcript_8588:150-1247(+)
MNALLLVAKKGFSGRQAMLIRRMATRAVANSVSSSIGQKRVWSSILTHSYSCASPESSDHAMRKFSSAANQKAETLEERANRVWDAAEPNQSWSSTLTSSSPESDFSSAPEESLEERANRIWENSDVDRTSTDMAYSISFASPESDFTSPNIQALLNDQQREQLANCEEASASSAVGPASGELAPFDTRRELLDDHVHVAGSTEVDDISENDQFHFEEIFAKTDAQPLPTTLKEAREINDDRAVVITEAAVPFKIVRVNEAWEGLCGYTQDEAKGHTLGDLLQGPETDVGAATALVDKLLHNMHDVGAVLTNYTKDGRKFQNRLRVGTLKNQHDKVTHFVGVLKEIQDLSEAFGRNGSGSKEMNS